jgi:hypothetical protein
MGKLENKPRAAAHMARIAARQTHLLEGVSNTGRHKVLNLDKGVTCKKLQLQPNKSCSRLL